MRPERLSLDPDQPLHHGHPGHAGSRLEELTRCCNTSPSAPPPRDLAAETTASINARYDNRDKLNTLNREQLVNQYQSLNDILTGNNIGGATGGLDLLGTISQRLSQQGATANSAQRGADIGDLEKLGGRAVSAIQGANPQQQALVGQLNQQATEGLAAGSSLTASQNRQAQQSARSASAARGLGYGQNDVTGEVLASLGLGNQLQQQRQNFGAQVAGINQATTGDPLMAITGRSSGVGGQAQNFFGGQQQHQAASAFDPNNPYAADLNNTNYNAQAAANIATANNNAALAGAGMSAL
jgi:hypothetical protein